MARCNMHAVEFRSTINKTYVSIHSLNSISWDVNINSFYICFSVSFKKSVKLKKTVWSEPPADSSFNSKTWIVNSIQYLKSRGITFRLLKVKFRNHNQHISLYLLLYVWTMSSCFCNQQTLKLLNRLGSNSVMVTQHDPKKGFCFKAGL